jgi:RES domain-containing protein
LILTAWRLTKQKHAKMAFSGEGARQFGGRWNNPGTLMVYTAQSQALAALEILVHLESAELLEAYVFFRVDIDPVLVHTVSSTELPKDWNAHPPPPRLREIGDEWALAQHSVVLRVPSALLPAENLFLLNPRHPRFEEIQIGAPIPFGFDPRLAR